MPFLTEKLQANRYLTFLGSNCARLLLLVLLLGAVTACGKMPSSVDAPADGAPSTFPRTYPNLATDPPR